MKGFLERGFLHTHTHKKNFHKFFYEIFFFFFNCNDLLHPLNDPASNRGIKCAKCTEKRGVGFFLFLQIDVLLQEIFPINLGS